MALHIGDNLEEVTHQRALIHAVSSPFLVIEEHFHESIGVGLAVIVLVHLFPVDMFVGLLHLALVLFVQVVLKTLAHVIMDACCRVGCHQFLTLCHHRKNAACHHGTAGIDSQVLSQEYLWEMLGNTLADAMMLALTYGSEVAQTLIRGLVELLQFLQHILAFAGQFPLSVSLAQWTQHTLIVILTDKPARAVASVVGKVERNIPLGCLRIVEVGQLTIIVQIVRTCQIRIGFDFLTSGLGVNGQGDAQ